MISEFVAFLGKRAIARPTLFQVEILRVPSLMQGVAGLPEFQKDLKFLCSGVEMPGTQMLTTENRHYDLPQKYVYMKAHDELVLTIRIDKDYLSKKFFDAWEDSMYNRNTGNVFYKSSYVGEIRISPMMEDGNCPYSMVIEDCFPTTIGNISYSWEATGQMAQINVNFAFTKKKIVARGALFNRSQTTGGNVLSGSNVLDFDVMEFDGTSLTKSNQYPTINNAFIDGLTQRTTSINSPIDISSISKRFNI